MANADQIQYWNEVSGPKWVRLDDRINAQVEALGHAAMDRAAVAAGERVLDVGCGCGPTSVELARRVGPAGRVLGLDISAPMLARARERIAQAEESHVSFMQADAQVHEFGSESFDVVFSRFGVMFFDDPVAAFSNLRSALQPKGRLVFLCWRELARNPWMLVPMAAIAPVLDIKGPAPSEDGSIPPGPFAFAESERVVDILNSAGFRDAECESLDARVALAGGLPLEEVIDFILEVGPAGAAMRDATPEQRQAAREAGLAALEPHAAEGEGVVLEASCWIVSARV